MIPLRTSVGDGFCASGKVLRQRKAGAEAGNRGHLAFFAAILLWKFFFLFPGFSGDSECVENFPGNLVTLIK
jgi:hypothetical protein